MLGRHGYEVWTIFTRMTAINECTASFTTVKKLDGSASSQISDDGP
jgi:hypothetical protein